MLPTPETLREANMQKRRARVLAAAHQLLAQQGFEGLNVRDVAHLAGVTVPTIYNLIGNKEQLLITLISDVLREIESRVHTVGDRTPGLHRDTDGSVTIVLQAHAPALHSERSNWLPAPEGLFSLSWRLYEPGLALLERRYVLPGVERVA